MYPFNSRAESSLHVSVMTFNIRNGTTPEDRDNCWEFRRDMVYGVIRERKPDFVGLQEAWKFQLDDILEALTDYEFIGRSREYAPETGEWCPILYRKDRFAVAEQATFWLSETPEEPGSTSWSNHLSRICSWGLFEDKISGQTIHIYNTHFDHQSQQAREKSALLCRESIRLQTQSSHWVFMGDLNADEDTKAIKHLTSAGEAAMIDTFRVLHPDKLESGTLSRWIGHQDGRKIDYVFVSRDKAPEILKAEIIFDHNEEGRYPSDHYPVWAILEFKE